jgi:orotidine-5'-phosphate decarboxylase
MPQGTPEIALDRRLIVALDLPEERAVQLARELLPTVRIFKVGLELVASSGGAGVLRRLGELGAQVFLDLKMLDIPETVTRALEALRAGHPHVVFATVHAFQRGLERALAGHAGSSLQVLVVTLLTSMDDADLRALGIARSAQDFALEQAARAVAAGCTGVIASPLEAAELRRRHPALTIVTPGIRPAWGAVARDDQKRIATPRQAILNGADHIVVGRPVYQHPPADGGPAEAARRILAEIGAALAERAGQQPGAPSGGGPRRTRAG